MSHCEFHDQVSLSGFDENTPDKLLNKLYKIIEMITIITIEQANRNDQIPTNHSDVIGNLCSH